LVSNVYIYETEFITQTVLTEDHSKNFPTLNASICNTDLTTHPYPAILFIGNVSLFMIRKH